MQCDKQETILFNVVHVCQTTELYTNKTNEDTRYHYTCIVLCESHTYVRNDD